jgi:hypothetical protein
LFGFKVFLEVVPQLASFDAKTLEGGCLLWVIDGGALASSKIDAYIILCVLTVGGESLEINVLSVLSPYLLILATIVISVS